MPSYRIKYHIYNDFGKGGEVKERIIKAPTAADALTIAEQNHPLKRAWSPGDRAQGMEIEWIDESVNEEGRPKILKSGEKIGVEDEDEEASK